MPAPKTTPAVNPLIEWPRESGMVTPILEMMEAKLRQRRQCRVKMAGRIAGLALLAAGAFWTIPYLRDTDDLNTSSAERRAVTLADGSTAELNARTELHTDFRYGRRTIEVTQGEAYFAVTKDAAHPFLVNTPSGTVRVTGTAFNVRLTPEGATVVTLFEGSVSFHHSGSASESDIKLQPQEQLSCDPAGVRSQVLTPSDMENAVAWRSGYLGLDGLSLADAVSRFASYHGRQIRVRPEVANLRLGGSCPLNDLPGFLAFVRDSAHVQIHSDSDGSFLISGP